MAAPPASAPSPGAPATSPGGWSTVTDDTLAAKSSGLGDAPSRLVATVARNAFTSDEEWRWDGNKSGLAFPVVSDCKSNNDFVFYPSCLHVTPEHTLRATHCTSPSLPHLADNVSDILSGLTSWCILLSKITQRRHCVHVGCINSSWEKQMLCCCRLGCN